jgi:hypothetical protein
MKWRQTLYNNADELHLAPFCTQFLQLSPHAPTHSSCKENAQETRSMKRQQVACIAFAEKVMKND